MALDCVRSHRCPLEMNLLQRLTGPGTAAVTAFLSDGREVGEQTLPSPMPLQPPGN